MKSTLTLVTTVLLLAVYAIFASTHSQKNKAVQAWEYKSTSCATRFEDINRLGSEGWEMVGASSSDGNCTIYFKRPI